MARLTWEEGYGSSPEERALDQLTVSGIGDDLASELHRLAAQEEISLNQAALRLLRRGAGLADRAKTGRWVGSSLDHLIGSWTPEEVGELDAALEAFEQIEVIV